MARIEGGALVLSGKPVESRQAFLAYVQPRVYYYAHNEYKSRYGDFFLMLSFELGRLKDLKKMSLA